MDFPAIPNMDRDFIELISSKRFKDSVDKVRTAMGDTRTIQGGNALMQLMGTVGQAMQKLVMIQNQNKKQLEDLAIELVKKSWVFLKEQCSSKLNLWATYGCR
jgi:hypothetical protein